jgi:2-hydroxychromene-2-carboxylate isomerase
MARVEFFYDYSSPWTYLAFTRIEDLCQRHDAELVWRPILVGGIFNTVNPSVYEARANGVPAKMRYMAKDLQDWARYQDVAITFPPTVFPVNSVKALRGAFFALERGCIGPYSAAVFRTYFGEDRDISQDAVLQAIVREVGLDSDAFFAAIATPAYKERLRSNTVVWVNRGGFGSPTTFLGDDIYFGNDRLVLVVAAIRRHASDLLVGRAGSS